MVEATKEEVRQEDKNIRKMHKLWWAFVKRFQIDDGEDFHWKYTGYPLIKTVEKWAKRYPQVTITNCDDDSHCSSILVFIPHIGLEEKLWGTSVVFISQLTAPVKFFLYPGEALDAVKALGRYGFKGKY